MPTSRDAEIEHLRVSQRTWAEEAMRSHDIIEEQRQEIELLRTSLASHQSALIAEQELAEQQQERIAELEALLRETAGERSHGRWSTEFREKVYDAIGKRYIKYE
jgi:hypothetical protein